MRTPLSADPETGTALAVDAVGAARAAMALQTGFDKKTVLNIRPAFLIVPAALELKAEQLVAQNLVPADSTKVVPQSIRTLSPISEPRLDAASPTAWYLAASPNQIDTIEYAYLEGQQGA
ncbi:MAG: Mu-like prophage major head subunit gpT family protein [Rhodobacterales bacterium]|nr:Mu-like prophage major head subunit gpT family protein [Rhodobacterales bacterium]